jgi:hypothetical protein
MPETPQFSRIGECDSVAIRRCAVKKAGIPLSKISNPSARLCAKFHCRGVNIA